MFSRHFQNMKMMMMIMMNCFCCMVDQRKVFSLISNWDRCQRSSSSWISDMQRGRFKPVQNLSSGLAEWSCAVVISTTPPCHHWKMRNCYTGEILDTSLRQTSKISWRLTNACCVLLKILPVSKLHSYWIGNCLNIFRYAGTNMDFWFIPSQFSWSKRYRYSYIYLRRTKYSFRQKLSQLS